MHVHVAVAETGFDVIGIVARTSNEKEMQGTGAISNLWQRFFTEQVLAKIPNKSDYGIIALYYDFASDKDGEYSILIGARVTSVAEVPTGMVAVHVPAEEKVCVLSQSGPVQAVVMDAWQQLWAMEDRGEIKRTYKGDYELYDERSLDPLNAQVEIHIGVK